MTIYNWNRGAYWYHHVQGVVGGEGGGLLEGRRSVALHKRARHHSLYLLTDKLIQLLDFFAACFFSALFNLLFSFYKNYVDFYSQGCGQYLCTYPNKPV